MQLQRCLQTRRWKQSASSGETTSSLSVAGYASELWVVSGLTAVAKHRLRGLFKFRKEAHVRRILARPRLQLCRRIFSEWCDLQGYLFSGIDAAFESAYMLKDCAVHTGMPARLKVGRVGGRWGGRWTREGHGHAAIGRAAHLEHSPPYQDEAPASASAI